MYKKMPGITERYVRQTGKVEFRAAVKFREAEVFATKVPYRIYFVFNDKQEVDLLGKFALSVCGGTEYLMSSVSFTREDTKPAMRDIMLNLMVENAINEARAFKVSYLVIETVDPKIVEATLDFNFSVRSLEMKKFKPAPYLYRCTKKLFFNCVA